MFSCGPVYHANINSKADIVINQGGTDSGKTYAIVQCLFTIATTQEPPAIDPVITVVGESVPNLKKGAYRLAKAIYGGSEALQRFVRTWNETDRTIYFKNGWIIEFVSYENEQQAKQGKRQYSFFNESQAMSWNVFWQVAKRTRVRTFIDYNPTAPFWVHEKLIGTSPETNDLTATVDLIISDHRHNPFLSEKEHARTEGIKDKELWRVYARGLTGNLTGLIFPDWKRIPDADYPKDAPTIVGLDFGYTNDPTAGVKISRVGESIFLHEICYTPGIAAKSIKELLRANGIKGEKPVYCEHDDNMIPELRRLGVLAYPAKKGPGSVNAGISKLKEFNVFYTESSVNLHTEKTKYMWLMDPVTGKPTNTPIDTFNHLMDAARYGVYTHYFRRQ